MDGSIAVNQRTAMEGGFVENQRNSRAGRRARKTTRARRRARRKIARRRKRILGIIEGSRKKIIHHRATNQIQIVVMIPDQRPRLVKVGTRNILTTSSATTMMLKKEKTRWRRLELGDTNHS